MSFRDLLELEFTRLGLKTYVQMAEKSGINYQYLRDVLAGKKVAFSDDIIIDACRKLSLNAETTRTLLFAAARDRAEGNAKGWWDGQLKEAETRASRPISTEYQLPPEPNVVPVYSAISAGSGNGHDYMGEVVDHITINEELRHMKVFVLAVQGESMISDLFPGEYAIFKPINGNPPKPTDICAIEVAGWPQWAVKFVEQDPSGLLLLKSSNPVYKIIEKQPEDVKIKGILVESRRVRRPPTKVAEEARKYGP